MSWKLHDRLPLESSVSLPHGVGNICLILNSVITILSFMFKRLYEWKNWSADELLSHLFFQLFLKIERIIFFKFIVVTAQKIISFWIFHIINVTIIVALFLCSSDYIIYWRDGERTPFATDLFQIHSANYLHFNW